MSAIMFAEENNLRLRFHINAIRIEQYGENTLKNIKALFKDIDHELIEIPWLDHTKFKQYICDNIDIGMQVSFTETFNIVTADHIDCNIPVVTSDEVSFVDECFQARCNNAKDIVKKLNNALSSIGDESFRINKVLLSLSAIGAKEQWIKTFCQ
jgi:hypothetical protein